MQRSFSCLILLCDIQTQMAYACRLKEPQELMSENRKAAFPILVQKLIDQGKRVLRRGEHGKDR